MHRTQNAAHPGRPRICPIAECFTALCGDSCNLALTCLETQRRQESRLDVKARFECGGSRRMTVEVWAQMQICLHTVSTGLLLCLGAGDRLCVHR